MFLKQCFKCQQTKPTTEFYRHPQMGDGLLGKCKECTKRDVAERESKLRNDPKWLAKERERCRIKQHNARILGTASKSKPGANKAWRARHPHKHIAHSKVNYALKIGAMIKPKTCNHCGIAGVKLHGHHPDYSQPLAVEWLCSKCHGKAHWKDQPK